MAEYVPSPIEWVREQVALIERTNGAEGYSLPGTNMAVVVVTNTGNKTGNIRKTPLMRVKDGDSYILVGSMGGAPKNPVWVYNLRENPDVELRDRDHVQPMRVREITDNTEYERLWEIAVAAFPNYAEYRQKTTRRIPVFRAEPA